MFKLPPMSAVRVFEAAARHQSFTRAAAELGMTQAAVSYQIKLLEDRIGTPLFRRLPRHVELTEKGRELAPAITEAFEALRVAFAAVEESAQTVISLSTLSTFASNWLIPRLGRFQALHPDIALRIDVSPNIIDFTKEDFDAAIRSGRGGWPGLTEHPLLSVDFTPVLSPALAERHELREPADLLQFPLIAPSDIWWKQWFAAAGVGEVDLSGRTDHSPGNQHLEGMAAIAGQGAAMVHPLFFKDDLAAGRLIQPFSLTVRSAHSYWLVYPKARKRIAKIAAFREWLERETQDDAQRSA
ncbi:MAG: LysR family transcriptional regulator [Microvirga sp.]|jgi:LysR family glycine cleavage system transcriptional activator|nr:LysR family transcriptional regulator [Microvirga sp.]